MFTKYKEIVNIGFEISKQGVNMSVSLGPLTLSWNASNPKPTTDSKVPFALGAAAGVATTLAATYLAPIAKPYVEAGAFKVYSVSAHGCKKVADTFKSAFVTGDNKDSYVNIAPQPAPVPAKVIAPRTWGDTALSVITLGFK